MASWNDEIRRLDGLLGDQPAAGVVAVDGDTGRTPDGERARWIGGNAPERAHATETETTVDMPGSIPATQAAQQAIDAGAEQVDTGERGYYGRKLMTLEDSQGDVMRDMVAVGLADPGRNNINDMFLGLEDQVTGKPPRRPDWEPFVEKAQAEKRQFIQTRFNELLRESISGGFSPEYRSRKGFANTTADSLARGTDQTQSTLYAFTNTLGETLGVDAMAKWGEQGMLANMTEAAQNPIRLATYEDVDSLADVGVYVLETLAENAPGLAMDLAVGAASAGTGAALRMAGIGKSLLRATGGAKGVGAADGISNAMRAGMAGSIGSQTIGDVRLGQYQSGLEDEESALGHAWGVGLANAGLEYVATTKVLENILKGASPGGKDEFLGALREAKDMKTFRQVAARAGALGTEASAYEGFTELFQAFNTELSQMALDPDQEMDLDNIDTTALADSFLRGVTFGGGVTTAGATVTGIHGAINNRNQDDLEKQQAEKGSAPDMAPPVVTDAEPVEDLVTHAEQRGAVWLSSAQSNDDVAQVMETLKKNGAVEVRHTEDGGLYLSTVEGDPLLEKEGPLTGDDFTRAKGYVPKSELNPEGPFHVVEAKNAEGATVEAIVADNDTLQATTEKVTAENPDTTVAVKTSDEVLIDRATRRDNAPATLEGVDTTEEATESGTVPQITPETLGERPRSRAREDQTERLRPVEDSQRGTAPVVVANRLRPTADLMTDFMAQRLDRKKLSALLKEEGIDVNRFANAQAPIDAIRTREAIRSALASNKSKAAKFADNAYGTPYEIADQAMLSLEDASVDELVAAAKQVGVEPKYRARLVKADDKAKRGPRDRVITGILSKLKDKKFPEPIKRRAAAQFVGPQADVSALMQELKVMDDNALVGVAEFVGAKIDGLTELDMEGEADIRGLFQELAERRGHRDKKQPAKPTAKADVAKAPVRNIEAPPLRKVQKTFDWLFDAEQHHKAPHLLVNELGGMDKAENKLRESMTKAAQQFPELGQEVSAVLNKKVMDKGTPVQQFGALVKAWQKVLSEPVEADEPSDGRTPDQRLFIAQTARDFGVLEEVKALAPTGLDSQALRRAYWQRHWPQADDSTPTAFVAKNQTDIEEAEQQGVKLKTRGRLRNLIRYMASTEGEFTLDEASAAPEQLAQVLALVVADNQSDPEGGVVRYLSENFLLGTPATQAEQAITSATSNSGSAQAGAFLPITERNQQEQSDLVFYRAVQQATLRFPSILEEANEGVHPSKWAGNEKAYQQVRNEFILSPVDFYQKKRDKLIPQLIKARGVKFGTDLGLFNLDDHSRSRARTASVGGKNLLLVNYARADGLTYHMLDAIALANYAKDSTPKDAAQALETLESNLARLKKGPESAALMRAELGDLPKIADDLVIWVDPDGKPVTAGEARTLSRKKRSGRSYTKLRNQLSEELDQHTGQVELRLLQLEQEAEESGDAANVAAVRQLYEEVFDYEAFKKSKRKSVLKDVAKVQSFTFSDGVVSDLKHALDYRITLLKRLGDIARATAEEDAVVSTSIQKDRAKEARRDRAKDEGIDSGQLDYREDRSENDIDEDGFDRTMASGGKGTFAMEGALREEELDGRPRSSTSAVPTDSDGEPIKQVDPLDRAALEADQGGELNSVEARVEFEATTVAEGMSAFERVAVVGRGLQLPLDNGDYAGLMEPGKPVVPKKPALAANKFRGIQLRGEAQKRKTFRGLMAYTRRMMGVVAKGMTPAERTRFVNTPIVIVQTGDLSALRQIAKDAGHLEIPRGMEALYSKPGYLNMGPVAVISMDPLRPGDNPAEWSLVYGHELGHMIYDQSWHQMDRGQRKAIRDIYFKQTTGQYNGREGFTGFKEWFADQMSSALAQDMTKERRSEYADATGPLKKALNFILDRLQRLWDAIQSDKAVRRLSRFKLNEDFAGFARRILRGQMPMSHRYSAKEMQVMHYTPEDKPMPRKGLEARMKQARGGKYRPTGLYRSVIGRIRGYNKALAGKLFQSANEGRVGDGSYEQKRFNLTARYSASLQRAFDQLGKGRKQEAAINAAYTELRDGKKTKGAKVLRTAIDGLLTDARNEGWATGDIGAGFTPHVFDHGAVEARRGEVLAMAKKAMPKVSDEDLNNQIDRIIDGFGIEDLSHEPMGPGKPVGTHEGARTLLLAIGPEKLAAEGLLLDKGIGILHHLATGLAKRTAWESTFGGYVNKDGKYFPGMQAAARRAARAGNRVFYDPNVQYKEALLAIEKEHGISAANEVKDLVKGAMGHNNLGVKPLVRRSQEWVTGITNLMILGFSGVASIPELATAFTRANFGYGDIMGSLRNYKEAKRFADDVGLAMTTGAEQAMRESMGEGYESGWLVKANNVFFQVNGQQFITRLSRTVATAVGMRFVLKAAGDGDYAALEKLGLTPELVKQWNDAGRPAYTPEMKGAHREMARQMSAGITQFVSEGTLNPNKFQSTNWGNNPYMKVIWHLKQFLWTFGDTIVMGIARNMKEQVAKGKAAGYSTTMSSLMALSAPTTAMALMMPLAIISLGLRGLLAGSDRFDEDWDELAVELARKTGAFAQWDLLAGLYTAHQWDQGLLGYTGALVPSVSVGNQIIHIDEDGLDVEKSTENLKEMAPLAGQWKGTWQWVFE